jgi:predicted AAA+ superfamily ATPase
LCAKKGIVPDDILYETPELNDFRGGMTENYVNNQLLANGYARYYWEQPSVEIDFIIQREGRLIPVEVKASDNVRSRSLDAYTGSFKPDYAVRVSTKNFGYENGIKSVPLYAVFCI